jgi:hypothetical protein
VLEETLQFRAWEQTPLRTTKAEQRITMTTSFLRVRRWLVAAFAAAFHSCSTFHSFN